MWIKVIHFFIVLFTYVGIFYFFIYLFKLHFLFNFYVFLSMFTNHMAIVTEL